MSAPKGNELKITREQMDRPLVISAKSLPKLDELDESKRNQIEDLKKMFPSFSVEDFISILSECRWDTSEAVSRCSSGESKFVVSGKKRSAPKKTEEVIREPYPKRTESQHVPRRTRPEVSHPVFVRPQQSEPVKIESLTTQRFGWGRDKPVDPPPAPVPDQVSAATSTAAKTTHPRAPKAPSQRQQQVIQENSVQSSEQPGLRSESGSRTSQNEGEKEVTHDKQEKMAVAKPIPQLVPRSTLPGPFTMSTPPIQEEPLVEAVGPTTAPVGDDSAGPVTKDSDQATDNPSIVPVPEAVKVASVPFSNKTMKPEVRYRPLPRQSITIPSLWSEVSKKQFEFIRPPPTPPPALDSSRTIASSAHCPIPSQGISQGAPASPYDLRSVTRSAVPGHGQSSLPDSLGFAMGQFSPSQIPQPPPDSAARSLHPLGAHIPSVMGQQQMLVYPGINPIGYPAYSGSYPAQPFYHGSASTLQPSQYSGDANLDIPSQSHQTGGPGYPAPVMQLYYPSYQYNVGLGQVGMGNHDLPGQGVISHPSHQTHMRHQAPDMSSDRAKPMSFDIADQR